MARVGLEDIVENRMREVLAHPTIWSCFPCWKVVDIGPTKDPEEGERPQAYHFRSSRKAAAAPGLKAATILDENNLENSVFPWLTDTFIAKGNYDNTTSTRGILKRSQDIYKFIDLFKTSKHSRMYFAVMRKNDFWCNVKVYPSSLGSESSSIAQKEVIVLELALSSNFIVKPVEFFKTMGGKYIVTESFGATTLHNFMRQHIQMNDDELKFYAQELVCAIGHLHNNGIIHRNLTAKNIGVCSTGHIKLFDIDMAFIALAGNGGVDPSPKMVEVVSTEAYMPPEMVKHELYSYTADWWSLGVILYYLMMGKMPFEGDDKRELLQNIMKSQPEFYEDLHSAKTNSLATGLLVKNPKQRLGSGGTAHVKAHVFFWDTDWHRVETLGYDPPFKSPAPVVTNIPNSMCTSLQNVRDGASVSYEVQDKKETRIEAERGVHPLLYDDLELDFDWINYLNPGADTERSLAYVPNELCPTKTLNFDNNLPLEDMLSKFPAISKSEEDVFALSESFDDYVYEKQPIKFDKVEEKDGFCLLPRKSAPHDILIAPPVVISSRTDTSAHLGDENDTFEQAATAFTPAITLTTPSMGELNEQIDDERYVQTVEKMKNTLKKMTAKRKDPSAASDKARKSGEKK